MDYALETQGLSKTYRGLRRVRALDPVDLKVEAGTVVGLLGSNGAGKSTLVKTVLGICRATTGRALLFGRDSRDPAARRAVGYLPEGTSYPRYLTGRGVCEYFGRLTGLSGERLRNEVNEKLKLVGMAAWGDLKVRKYSKGMKQRVGLAQALLGNPRLVFLDEPTDGVDPAGRHEIRDLIARLGKDGVTVFLNSHLLAEVEVVCREIAIMYRGRILRRGKVSEIIQEMSGKGGMQQLRFRTGPLPATLPELPGKATPTDDGLMLEVADRNLTSRAIDALRGANVEIFAVEAYRASLEEAFLHIMDTNDYAGVGGQQ
ncbi:MAG: ABC transporter ATP-binding protein [Planctomycetes bacterium]|nr:ABC transporter ATP-binding protein [Planctomycetota bacterium]